MADGSQGFLTTAKPLSAHHKRQLLESALDRLLGAVDGVLADLDAIDGDPDLEGEEDVGCEDEGWDSDSEPDAGHTVPTYADDGHDQTRIVGSWQGTFLPAGTSPA